MNTDKGLQLPTLGIGAIEAQGRRSDQKAEGVPEAPAPLPGYKGKSLSFSEPQVLVWKERALHLPHLLRL